MNGTPLTAMGHAHLVAAIMRAMPRDMPDTTAFTWESNGEELKRRLAFLRQPAPKRDKPVINVLSSLTFEERIKNGCYDRANPGLTESKFPVTEDQQGEWEWKLFHFNRGLSTTEAIRLISLAGFEPAKIGHLLTFGETYPEEQRKYPIIGLGSQAMIVIERRTPVLWCVDEGRAIDHYWYDVGYNANYRFLGVRRPVTA